MSHPRIPTDSRRALTPRGRVLRWYRRDLHALAAKDYITDGRGRAFLSAPTTLTIAGRLSPGVACGGDGSAPEHSGFDMRAAGLSCQSHLFTVSPPRGVSSQRYYYEAGVSMQYQYRRPTTNRCTDLRWQ